jgi:branched-chain amino acid transport system substrate-binding protein
MTKRAVVFIGLAIFCFWPAAVPSQGSANDEVVIGFVGPLTGGAAFIGVDALHGALLAADDVNAAGGITVGGKKYNLRIESYDDANTPAKAVAGFKKMYDRFQIPVLICNTSGSAKAVTEINERMGVLWTGFSTYPDLTTRGNKLVLRTTSTAKPTTAIAVETAMEILKPKTFTIMADSSDFGRAQEAQFREQLQAKGVEYLGTEWFDQRKESDFRVLITKVKGMNPDAVVVLAYDEPTGQIIKQMRELGLKTPTITSTGFQIKGIEVAGAENIEGCVGVMTSSGFAPPPASVLAYREKYKKRFDNTPSGFGQNNYELVRVIAKGMEKSGTVTDAAKIKEGMRASVPVPLADRTGWIEGWDEAGEVTVFQTGVVFRGGKRVDKNGKLVGPPEK